MKYLITVFIISISTVCLADPPAGTEIFSETWESNNTLAWRCDYASAGDSSIVTITPSPYAGTYSFKMLNGPTASPGGNWVHGFGDNPYCSGASMTDGNQVTDLLITEYIYPDPSISWVAGLKLWVINAFEDWGAGYSTAAGSGKPHTWAAYYCTIYINSSGYPMMQIVRADGLPGGDGSPSGALWQDYPQNVGGGTALIKGQWNKLQSRLKLNTADLSDGIFQLWLNDVLVESHTDINYRDAYTTYGWNHPMLSIDDNDGFPSDYYLGRDSITFYSVNIQPASTGSGTYSTVTQ